MKDKIIRIRDVVRFSNVNKALHAIKQGTVEINNGRKTE